MQYEALDFEEYKKTMKNAGVDLVTTSEISDWREHRLKDEEINKLLIQEGKTHISFIINQRNKKIHFFHIL